MNEGVKKVFPADHSYSVPGSDRTFSPYKLQPNGGPDECYKCYSVIAWLCKVRILSMPCICFSFKQPGDFK